MRFLTLPVAAVAGLTAVLAPAAPALAAPRHGASHAEGHDHGRAHGHPDRVRDHLAGARQGAAHLIDAQSKNLTRQATAEGTVAGLNDADRTALVSATQAAVAALAGNKAALAAATSLSQIRALAQSAVLTHAGAELQFRVVKAADAQEATGTALTTAAADLQAQVDAAAAVGTDTTAAQAALTDLASQVTAAAASDSAATSGVLALAPGADWTTILGAGKSAGTGLSTAATALTTAQSDLTTAKAAVAG